MVLLVVIATVPSPSPLVTQNLVLSQRIAFQIVELCYYNISQFSVFQVKHIYVASEEKKTGRKSNTLKNLNTTLHKNVNKARGPL